MKILISVMFNENEGSYALQGNNIVHETINLLKADDGNHYIYIAPHGNIPKSNKKIDYLLLVRAFSKGTVQVVSLIENLTYISETEDNQLKKQVTYGGKPLSEFYKENSGDDPENDRCITYKTQNHIWKPKSDKLILISNDNLIGSSATVITIEPRIRNQSMRLFLTDKETRINIKDEGKREDAIKKAESKKKAWKLINDELIQKKKELFDETSLYTVAETDMPNVKPTFMDIIGKADNELAFSNMFAYFFSKYPIIFKEFLKYNSIKKDFDVSKFKTEKLSMEREKNHIDIYATDGNWHIIIENKIKSGINGIGNKKNGKYESQLSKYIEELTNPNKKEEKKTKKEKNKKQEVNREDIICFLLHPQYMQFNLDSFEKGEEYNKVSYKDLYELFDEHKAIIKKEDQLFFKLMLDALRKHTKDRDTDIEERMIKRFIQRIEELNKKEPNIK